MSRQSTSAKLSTTKKINFDEPESFAELESGTQPTAGGSCPPEPPSGPVPCSYQACRAGPRSRPPAAAPARPTRTGQRCDAKLSTHALSRPGDRSYPLAHQLFDPRFDTCARPGSPICGNATDVGTCIAFVKKFKMRFRVRSGGHSYAGWSSLDNGLVIDVTRINHFTGRERHRNGRRRHRPDPLLRATSRPRPRRPRRLLPHRRPGRPGARRRHRRAVRQFGLTCDAIESLQIVTADGKVLNCDSKIHTDLLWASKGGGGGNFGVATSFTHAHAPSSARWCCSSCTGRGRRPAG